MAREPSQEKSSPGSLYVVGMPLGHQDDITLRALRLLRQVDIVAAKDPLSTATLFHHHRIRTTITTYDRRNAWEKAPVLLQQLRDGRNVALVSDGGTPGLYDPGTLLVRLAARARISVTSVPGPSSLTATVAITGMPADSLFFRGRFPTRTASAKRMLAVIKKQRCSSVFFIPPVRLRQILRLLLTLVGNRTVVIAIDLTKPPEQVLRGKIIRLLATHPLRYARATAVTLVVGTK